MGAHCGKVRQAGSEKHIGASFFESLKAANGVFQTRWCVEQIVRPRREDKGKRQCICRLQRCGPISPLTHASGWLRPRQTLKRGPITDVNRGTLDCQQMSFLKGSQQARYGFAGHADHLSNLLLSQRDLKTIQAPSVIDRPAKQESRQFFGSGTRKPQRLNHFMPSVMTSCQEMSHLDNSFRVRA